MTQLQLTPWHLAQEYSAVVQSNRNHFAISGPGDSSGSRGEAISFLRAPQTEVSERLELASFQRLNNVDLVKHLLSTGIDHGLLESLTRWERLELLRERMGSYQHEHSNQRTLKKRYERL